MEYTTEYNSNGGFRFDIQTPPEAENAGCSSTISPS